PLSYLFFFSYTLPPPHIPSLFPYTTLFRSVSRRNPAPVPRSLRCTYFRCRIPSCRPSFSVCCPEAASGVGRQRVLQPFQRKEKLDRKSTRLNSSHRTISYAVFCLKKKKKQK